MLWKGFQCWCGTLAMAIFMAALTASQYYSDVWLGGLEMVGPLGVVYGVAYMIRKALLKKAK